MTSDPRRRQLFRSSGSLFDSDVYETYTAAYAWASNQAAHTGLGFIAAATVAVLFPWTREHGWVLFLPYVAKESIDLVTASRTFTGSFRIPMSELVIDSTADATFFSLGVAYLFLSQTQWGVAWMLGGLALAALVFGWHFLPKKRAFDKAGLPYFYRLGRYNAQFAPDLRDDLLAFVGASEGNIVIAGKKGAGKTTLAVAMASECTVREQYAVYSPAPSALEEVAAGKRDPSKLGEPWKLHEADVVVIDDCVGLQFPPDVSVLRNKRLIWVLSALGDAGAGIATIEAAFGPARVIDVDLLGYKAPAK